MPPRHDPLATQRTPHAQPRFHYRLSSADKDDLESFPKGNHRHYDSLSLLRESQALQHLWVVTTQDRTERVVAFFRLETLAREILRNKRASGRNNLGDLEAVPYIMIKHIVVSRDYPNDEDGLVRGLLAKVHQWGERIGYRHVDLHVSGSKGFWENRGYHVVVADGDGNEWRMRKYLS